MTEQSATFADQVSDVAAIMSQAKSVLDLLGCYGELKPEMASAVYGAATIVEAAINALDAIEEGARHTGAVA